MKRLECYGLCNDKKHAFQKLREIERIRHQLERYVKKKENVIKHSRTTDAIMHDVIHLHFMCGNCSEFHDMNFTQEQNRIHYAAYSLYYNICEGLISVKDYNEILRLLAGNYPGIYRTLQDAWRKYKNSGKES